MNGSESERWSDNHEAGIPKDRLINGGSYQAGSHTDKVRSIA